MTRLDDVTETDVSDWWNTGPKTITDLREKGNRAVLRHILRVEVERPILEAESRQRVARRAEQCAITDSLNWLAEQPWALQVWPADPRFKDLLPRSRMTVRELCRDGTIEERRVVWDNLVELKTRVKRIEAQPLNDAIAGYVEAISRQRGVRLDVLLARTGLNGQDPITGREAATMLGVSRQRIEQIVGQLHRNRDRASPAGGIWLPQVDEALNAGWPDGHSRAAIEASRRFFGR